MNDYQKDVFSSSCDKGIGKIIKKMNRIASELNFPREEVKLREKIQAS